MLERLPTKISRKWVVCCYLTDNPGKDVCGMFFVFYLFLC